MYVADGQELFSDQVDEEVTEYAKLDAGDQVDLEVCLNQAQIRTSNGLDARTVAPGAPASRVNDKERAMQPGRSPFCVQLKSAMLCVEAECSTVFDGGTARTCPRCGSSTCYPISIWLDRVERVHAA